MIDWKKVKEDHGMTDSQLHDEVLLAALSVATVRMEKTGASKLEFVGDDGEKEIILTVVFGDEVD